MSRYIQINDDKEPAELSSNSGWSQFIDWSESLDANEYPEIAKLANDGATKNPQMLADQIEHALKNASPIPDVGRIAETIFSYLDGESGAATVI